MYNREYTKKIGSVGVDAGCIWIGDPCYIMGDDASFKVDKWEDFCNLLNEFEFDENNFAEPLGKGIGTVVSSGYGDGEYPVYATISHGRVKSVKIQFFGDEEDEDYNDPDDRPPYEG